jgi:hypothetical protein
MTLDQKLPGLVGSNQARTIRISNLIRAGIIANFWILPDQAHFSDQVRLVFRQLNRFDMGSQLAV